MQTSKTSKADRRQDRIKAVLPVRISGTDASGKPFDELVHTLDITPSGGRLGAIHKELKALDRLTVQYRQHRVEFRVVWTRLLDKGREYQAGLQMIGEEKTAWGLGRSDGERPTHSIGQHPAALAAN